MLRSLKIAALALASIGSCDTIIEHFTELPPGWAIETNAAINPGRPIRMSIALQQPRINSFRSRLLADDASTSPHITKEEAETWRAPNQEDVEAVMTWLDSKSINETRLDNGWIHFRTSLSDAEEMLEMKMEMYKYEGHHPVLRTTNYSVPTSLLQAIDFIHPIANFMVPKHDVANAPKPLVVRAEMGNLPACGKETTPDCIRQLYDMPAGEATGNLSSTRFGVAGFLNQYANYDDIDQFLTTSAPALADAGFNFSTELVNGGQNLQRRDIAGPEANLDMQYAMALGYPTNVTFYSTGGHGVLINETGEINNDEYADNEPFLDLFGHLLNLPDDELPQVLSISYADDELSVPRPYAERVCDLMGLLSARGTSIIVGSGDGGARGTRNSNCRTNDGNNIPVAMASFPATCPWVTAVGAVSNMNEPPSGAVFSGGGFSQYFPAEEWQQGDIDIYTASIGDTLKPYYNKQMRAVPDISAIGNRFITIQKGQETPLAGTSASTPVVASMIALINDARAKYGKQSLGWLNKRLYSASVREVLQDVTSGVSTSCVFEDGKVPGGWPAAKGWDAITGLGVPNRFPDLMRVLLDDY